jgi:uncharacterized protein (DUF2252 family)
VRGELAAHRLAERQLELDRARTAGMPRLLAHKIDRMRASPFAFLRGAAPLFYEILTACPDLATGPAGNGFVVGDLHLENFGAYRPDPIGAASRVVFDLNDFDDTQVAPLRLDMLRLLVSVLLATRELQLGVRGLELAERLLASYARTLTARPRTQAPPAPVAELVERVAARTRRELLDARTRVVGGVRRFTRGPRYLPLPASLARTAERAFAAYVAALPAEARAHDECYRVLDMAFRVAGTGSLGSLRVAVLVAGKGTSHGAWIFDMKEERPSALARIGRRRFGDDATRVKTGIEACLEHPPRSLGTARIGGKHLLVRRLAPQEDKLALAALAGPGALAVVDYLGARVAQAHRRGMPSAPASAKAWDARAREPLVRHAIELAGLHEAVFLAYCRLTRRGLT